MKEQLIEYRKLQQDLMNQLTTAKDNKVLIQRTISKLYQQYTSGFLNQENYNYQMQQFLQGKTVEQWNSFYDAHIARCEEGLLHYAAKITEVSTEIESKRGTIAKLLTVVIVLGLFFSFMTFIPSGFTGLFISAGS